MIFSLSVCHRRIKNCCFLVITSFSDEYDFEFPSVALDRETNQKTSVIWLRALRFMLKQINGKG